MSASILNSKDYKAVLKTYIHHANPKRGVMTRMSQAAGCQPSYLSQVLSGHVHITPDQALALSEFMNFSNIEAEYFLLLVDLARAGSTPLKKRIEGRLENLKKESEDLSKRLGRKPFELDENQAIYYSSWIWSALHILVSIPQFQTTEAIAKKLGIDLQSVTSYLEKLEQMGFVKRERGLWKHGGVELHLSKNSPFISLHHNNWRQLAVLKSQNKNENSVHFSGIYTVNSSDFEKVKELLLKFISQANETSLASTEERLICINADLFEVS